MLKLQEFIKENPKDFREKLSEKPYCIKTIEDNHHILFKYNQIGSDFNIELVRECRGIILYKEDWSVACFPFSKFGNFGESYAPEIDWSSAKIFEKLDGSLIKYWFSKALNHPVISTNGTIDAHDAEINYPGFYNFADLFWYTIEKMNKFDEIHSIQEQRDKTFLFEICTPANRIVVPHTEYKLYHLATKLNNTGEEVEIDAGFPKPKRYNLGTLDECIRAAEKLPFQEEGYVVVDKYLNRLKIKSSAYVRCHKLRGEGSLTYKKILSIVRENEHEEYLTYYPEDKPYFDEVQETLENFYSSILSDLVVLEEKGKFFNSRKEAAEWIKAYTTFPAICFALLDGKVSSGNFKEFFNKMSDDKLLSYTGFKE